MILEKTYFKEKRCYKKNKQVRVHISVRFAKFIILVPWSEINLMETTDINSQHASSVLDRLDMALKDDSFLIHTPKLNIDHERLYRQELFWGYSSGKKIVWKNAKRQN